MKWMKKKEPTPSLTPPPSQSFTIPPNLYPTLPFSVGSYKLDFFSLFPIKFWGTLFSIQYHFFLNLSHIFRLFAATLFPKFLILLSSFRKLLNEKNQCFWHCIYVIWIKVICDFESEKYHYKYYESQKLHSVMLTYCRFFHFAKRT